MRYISLIFLLYWTCHIPQHSSLCKFPGKLLQTEGLDGCTWLIQVADGRKLLPVNAEDFDLADQQYIEFSYLPYEGMSTCMAEDEMIILTCVQTKYKPRCKAPVDWQDISWVTEMVKSGSILKIDRYTFGQDFLYALTQSDRKVVWCNCHGQVICHEPEWCDLPMKEIKDQVTIFVAHR